MNAYEKTVAWWRSKSIADGDALAEALREFGPAFAYHSGKIENDRITRGHMREIFEHDSVTSYTGDLRTLHEMRNARIAHEFLLASFDRRSPLDEAFIRELQGLLTQNTYDARRLQLGEQPGEYKLHDYVTGRNEVGAAPEDVSEEMGELLEELTDAPGEHILTAAAYFHVKLENIHPFADGNGRVGRLAMNYLLVTHDHPPVIVHEEDRAQYFAALEAWDSGQELSPMRDFLTEQLVKTWRLAI